jgi:hypothetical protein
MGTETTGAENTLQEQEAFRKPGRLLPTMISPQTAFDFKATYVKGQYKFRNK